MATISYVNDVLPIGGRSFNPGFEEVLDPTLRHSAPPAPGVYELVNNDNGPFKDFKVQFLSNVNGRGNFTYVIDGNSGEVWPSGTITGMFLRAPDGTVIAQVIAGAAGLRRCQAPGLLRHGSPIRTPRRRRTPSSRHSTTCSARPTSSSGRRSPTT